MRLFSRVLGTFLFLLLSFSLADFAAATSCQEDCHKRCRKCAFGACVVEPTCHVKCEVEKKAACAIKTPIPTIPGPGAILDPGKALCQATYLPAYQSFTHGVIAYCANWAGRGSDLGLVDTAKNLLIRAGLFQAHEFNGVDMRWCPINGSGMVPAANRVLLNPNLKGNMLELAVTLAHEMVHVRQFRRWPNEGFECRYGEELVKGRGQGTGNSVEREAYQFEPQARQEILRVMQQPAPQPFPQPMPQPFPQPQPLPGPAMSNRCGTPFFACFMGMAGPIGGQCYCASPQGPVYGQIY